MSNHVSLVVAMQGVDKIAGECPCRECTDRYPGCHGKCEDKYLKWKNGRLDERKEYLRKEGGAMLAEQFRLDSGVAINRRKGKHMKNRGW